MTLSLNTVSKRKELMGDRDPEKTLANIAALRGKVKFDGSIVALPFVTGFGDMEDSIKFLRDAGATTVRLLLPGFRRAIPCSRRCRTIRGMKCADSLLPLGDPSRYLFS